MVVVTRMVMVFVIVVILRILGYPIHWTLSRHQPHQATAVDNYENGIKEDVEGD